MSFVLSHYQTAILLAARRQGATSCVVSIDLGITTSEVALAPDRVVFPDQSSLDWHSILRIDADKNGCYFLKDHSAAPLRGYSETLGRAYSLMPTVGAPVLVAAGFPMHRFKNITPQDAARAMVEPLLPIRGKALDTATGLGYTAIIAAESAHAVTTIERCPVAQEMARMNPWSRSLFSNPKIGRVIGDSGEVIQTIADSSFTAIIHDPPTVALAGELYSGAFYRQAHRILQPGGRMFHYTGDPRSRAGSTVTKGVVKRLHEAGFGKVVPVAGAYGVVADKR